MKQSTSWLVFWGRTTRFTFLGPFTLYEIVRLSKFGQQLYFSYTKYCSFRLLDHVEFCVLGNTRCKFIGQPQHCQHISRTRETLAMATHFHFALCTYQWVSAKPGLGPWPRPWPTHGLPYGPPYGLPLFVRIFHFHCKKLHYHMSNRGLFYHVSHICLMTCTQGSKNGGQVLNDSGLRTRPAQYECKSMN